MSDVKADGLSVTDVMKFQQCSFITAVRELNFLLNPAVSSEKKKLLREALQMHIAFE